MIVINPMYSQRNIAQHQLTPQRSSSRGNWANNQYISQQTPQRNKYTNVYQQNPNFYSNSRINQRPRHINQSGRSSQRNMQRLPNPRPLSINRNLSRNNSRMSSMNRGNSMRSRADSLLNNPEPDSMISAANRKMPIQRSHSHSRNFIAKIEKTGGSRVSEEDDRIQGNTFLNVPKVQINYGNSANRTKKVKNRMKIPKIPKRPKMNLKAKLQKMGYTPSTRMNPILNKPHMKRKSGRVQTMTTNGKFKKSWTRDNGQRGSARLSGYEKIQRKLQSKNLFQDPHKLTRNNQLRENIFERRQEPEQNMIRNASIGRNSQNSSRLENYFNNKVQEESRKQIKTILCFHKAVLISNMKWGQSRNFIMRLPKPGLRFQNQSKLKTIKIGLR